MKIKYFNEFINESLNNIKDSAKSIDEIYTFYEFINFDDRDIIFNKLLEFYNANETPITSEEAVKNINILIDYFLENNTGKFFDLIDGNPSKGDFNMAINFVIDNIINTLDIDIDINNSYVTGFPEEGIKNIIIVPLNDEYCITINLDYINILNNYWDEENKKYSTEIGFFKYEGNKDDLTLYKIPEIDIITDSSEIDDFIDKIKLIIEN